MSNWGKNSHSTQYWYRSCQPTSCSPHCSTPSTSPGRTTWQGGQTATSLVQCEGLPAICRSLQGHPGHPDTDCLMVTWSSCVLTGGMARWPLCFYGEDNTDTAGQSDQKAQTTNIKILFFCSSLTAILLLNISISRYNLNIHLNLNLNFYISKLKTFIKT